jgi:hypothetical protein
MNIVPYPSHVFRCIYSFFVELNFPSLFFFCHLINFLIYTEPSKISFTLSMLLEAIKPVVEHIYGIKYKQ